MPIVFETIAYPLQAQGYIDHWLVAGPQAVSVPNLEAFAGSEVKTAIAEYYDNRDALITEPPAELAATTVVDQAGAQTFPWRVVHCLDDHFVDLSAFYHTCHYLRAWAYTEVNVPTALDLTAVLTTNGPADLWVNGRHVHRHLHFHHQIPGRVSFPLTLQAGKNTILVRMEAVAIRECPYAMALQLQGINDAADWQVTLPTTLAPKRRQPLEAIFAAATLDRSTFHRDDEIIVRWPADLPYSTQITVRLQTPDGRIYAEGQPVIKGGAQVNLGKAYQRADGLYWVTLMPELNEYYVHGMKIVRHLPLQIINSKFTESSYGSYRERATEALTDAAGRNLNIYSEIAKMALGQWDKLNLARWSTTLASINDRADCSDFYLVGILGALLRYGAYTAFPATLRQEIAHCALNFKYWLDEPSPKGALDAMCYWSENHQILFHACEVLAGQLFPEEIFTNVDQPGEWHRQRGEERALQWLRKRARGGFREWDSNVYFEHDVLALAHLADLAENTEVAEMAAIILDKLCFTLAINSFQGIFGSTHGRSYTPYLKGGRLELTSGITRLLWGIGNFNEHFLGSVALACAAGYELPPAIDEIGRTAVEEMWSRERHAGTLEPACDCASGTWEVNKVTYKTADYMLCSAQDYQPGAAGYQQHIWQATLGVDAVVFVTHPPCSSEEGSHRPNFWHGNAILPRVAQWKDLLIAVHQLPTDDWLGFTHAYFPTAQFDEYTLRDGWAFARKRDGYLALKATAGMQLITQGPSAYEELRSHGLHNIWLCQMGRAAQNGSFRDFQEQVLALAVIVDELEVKVTNLRGEELSFGWRAPLCINGEEQTITGFPHYDNPFCTSALDDGTMVIRSWNHAMQLDFA